MNLQRLTIFTPIRWPTSSPLKYTHLWKVRCIGVTLTKVRPMARHDEARNSRTVSKPAGIKEIAKALNVSIGTVDRALHSRPGINPMTRAKVLKMAQTMGYRPNLAARFLKSQRQLEIAVHLPVEIASFFDALRDGIQEAAAPFGPAVHLEFRSYPRLGEGDAELFEEALDKGAQGMIIAPGEPAIMKPLIRKAARRNVPVVCVSTDAPGTERLTAITACPYTSGAIVGELLCRMIAGPGTLGVVTGSIATEDHADKLEGFRASVQAIGPHLGIAAVIQAHDDASLAYSETKALLAATPDLRGIYVSTSNSPPFCKPSRNPTRPAASR